MEGSTFLPAAVPARSEFRELNGGREVDRLQCISPKREGDNVLRGVVLRVLSRFPEAYAAVREALIQATGEPAP